MGSPIGFGIPVAREQSTPTRKFARTSAETCESTWSNWPEMQDRAIDNGTVLLWNLVLCASVGHFMRTLVYILPVRTE